MRISVYDLDYARRRNIKVFLNGIKLKGCFAADEEQGIAYVFKKDYLNDSWLVMRDINGEWDIMRGFVKGHVVIKEED